MYEEDWKMKFNITRWVNLNIGLERTCFYLKLKPLTSMPLIDSGSKAYLLKMGKR